MTVKACRNCGETKDISQFHLDRQCGGYKLDCNVCRNKLLNEKRATTRTWSERIRTTKYRAKKKGREFDLTDTFLESLWNSQQGLCFYTGQPMLDQFGTGASKSDSVSIDRVDSKRGYTQDNVVLCCNRANMLKSDMTVDELGHYFPEWASKITNYMKEN